jgi:hypothetical protein
MALPATLVLEVRTTGSDNNGGGFNAARGGTDRSQQDSPYQILTDVIAVLSNTCSSATYTFVAADAGNILNFAGGSRFEIISVSGGVATLDRNHGATADSNLGTTYFGGAVASLGVLGAVAVAGNTIWMKSGTYSISSSTANVSNGRFSNNTGGGSATVFLIEGYQSTRGDRAARPLINVTTSLSGADAISLGGNDSHVVNIEIAAGANAINSQIRCSGQGGLILLCKASGSSGASGAMQLDSNGMIDQCYASVSGAANKALVATSGGVIRRSYASNSTAGSSAVVVGPGCLESSIVLGGVSFTSRGQIVNSTIDGKITLDSNASRGVLIENSIVCNVSSGYAITINALGNSVRLRNVAFYNNTGSGNYDATKVLAANVEGTVALSADPFTNRAGGDYSLNSTAGGGAALKAAGLGSFPGSASVGYPDIGAVQSRGGGILNYPSMNGVGE